jgi:hypothetical protein
MATRTRNFVMQMLGDATRRRYRGRTDLIPELAAAQCAADISSLLPEMDRPEWLAFRAGYLYRLPGGQEAMPLT